MIVIIIVLTDFFLNACPLFSWAGCAFLAQGDLPFPQLLGECVVKGSLRDTAAKFRRSIWQDRMFLTYFRASTVDVGTFLRGFPFRPFSDHALVR